MNIADLTRLPLTERLAAMETLWDSLTHEPAHNPSPAWHGQVLAERRQQLAEGLAQPWNEAKHSLHRLADGGHRAPR